jgi:hypothetical protein
MKLITHSPNGQIFMCPRRKVLHVEYGNIFLMLSFEDFKKLVDYVNSIDYEFYLQKNAHAQNKRKLLLNIGFDEMFMALNKSEFLEFKSLLTLKKCPHILNTSQILNNALQLN